MTTFNGDIHIVSGNPFGNSGMPASYSKFIFPFAYSLSDEVNNAKNLLWKPSEQEKLEQEAERRKYFTCETEKVLFDNAKWCELKKKDGSPFHLIFEASLHDGTRKIRLNPPKLVLFEYSTPTKTSNKEKHLLQTGFLIIELFFEENEQPTFCDLLKLNELFRYREPPFTGHEERMKKLLPDDSKKKLFDSETARPFYEYWEFLISQPLFLDEKPCTLLPKEKEDNPKRKEWDIYADNRNFVWTCAVLEDGGKLLQKKLKLTSDILRADEYGHWIKLLNVDYYESNKNSLAVHSSREFERDWAKERTYHRWEEWGTFYGFSYHSGAALIPPLNEPYDVPLWKHWATMYFDMILLLFYIRVTLFRFSRELTDISSEARNENHHERQIENWCKAFEDMRWGFSLFTNLYQFPLISNQQQGLEM